MQCMRGEINTQMSMVMPRQPISFHMTDKNTGSHANATGPNSFANVMGSTEMTNNKQLP